MIGSSFSLLVGLDDRWLDNWMIDKLKMVGWFGWLTSLRWLVGLDDRRQLFSWEEELFSWGERLFSWEEKLFSWEEKLFSWEEQPKMVGWFGWSAAAFLLRGSQFSNTAPSGSKPITYFSSLLLTFLTKDLAEKLLKRQCLEFVIFTQLW